MRTGLGASELAFVDTNVFVYAQDRREPKKHSAAISLLGGLNGHEQLVISTQVINELCSVLPFPY